MTYTPPPGARAIWIDTTADGIDNTTKHFLVTNEQGGTALFNENGRDIQDYNHDGRQTSLRGSGKPVIEIKIDDDRDGNVDREYYIAYDGNDARVGTVVATKSENDPSKVYLYYQYENYGDSYCKEKYAKYHTKENKLYSVASMDGVPYDSAFADGLASRSCYQPQLNLDGSMDAY